MPRPSTLAYWSSGFRVPDMWSVPGTVLRKREISEGSMHVATRYSPSLSVLIDLTNLSEPEENHAFILTARSSTYEVLFSPLSMSLSVLASPRSRALSTADSRSERDIPNFAIILSSMKSSVNT